MLHKLQQKICEMIFKNKHTFMWKNCVVNHTTTVLTVANKTEEGSELVLNDLVIVGKCPVQQVHSSLYACFSIYICLLFGLCYIYDIIKKLYYKIR